MAFRDAEQAPGAPATARLVVVSGESAGLAFRLGPTSTVGRDPQNTIRLLDEKTSRHHAVFRFTEGAWTLQDLGSVNGTWVEGEGIEKPVRLRGGEAVRLGDTSFRFEWSGEMPPEPACLELPDRSSVRIVNAAGRVVEISGAAEASRLESARSSGEGPPPAGARGPGLEVVWRLQKALSELREMDDLARTLLEELFRAVPATRGALLAARADGGLEPVAIRAADGDPGDPGERGERIPIGRTLLRQALATREAVMLSPGGPGDASMAAAGVRSAITAPLVYQGRLLGVLHLEGDGERPPFTRDDLDLVATAAGQAAVAVANTRLLERVRRDAEHRANLQRYLAPGLVEQLLAGGHVLDTDGATRQCTVMFADLRGFTAMSEWLPSKEVFATLNACFQRMVDVIHAHGGSVDKFIGDAIMAVWGIPAFSEDDAAHAVLAAVRMQQELVHFNLEREAQGKPGLAMGVALHSGPVLAGNLGARQRLEYTVIGDTVNLASRLERLAGAGQVIVSGDTMEWIRSRVDATERPPVRVKGKRLPVKTFEVHGLRDAAEETTEMGRSHPRHKTSARVVLFSENGGVHEGLLADLSTTGAGVKILPEQILGLEPGMGVRLPVGGTREPEAPALEGMVARLILTHDHAGQALFKAGIRFRDPPERVRELTRSWVTRSR